MHIGGVPFFSYELRRRFAETLKIPNRTYMWVSTFNGRAKIHGLFRSYYVHGILKNIPGWEWHVLTYGVGHLVFQVVSWSNTKHYHLKNIELPAIQRDPPCAAAVQFWPHSPKPIRWPLSPHLDNETLEHLYNGWRLGADFS
jgi:hypothetical protein